MHNEPGDKTGEVIGKNEIKLGQEHAYVDTYTRSLLQPIARKESRKYLPQNQVFEGRDFWNAYEISWLDSWGIPKVAIAEFVFPASSKNIIESKSFKYYLNSFNQTVFTNASDVKSTMQADLSAAAGGEVKARFMPIASMEPALSVIPGQCIDDLSCEANQYQPDAKLLRLKDKESEPVPVLNQRLFSHLLKSNCPVTGQPDWATLWIEYSGPEIDAASLLTYVVSFRQYEGFHESCVERIFTDILAECGSTELTVYARYTRRGGLDINPIRSTQPIESLPFGRTSRQ